MADTSDSDSAESASDDVRTLDISDEERIGSIARASRGALLPVYRQWQSKATFARVPTRSVTALTTFVLYSMAVFGR